MPADHRYQKTEAGRAEIKARSLVNSRVARNLLLVIDASKPAAEWISLVQGASSTDLELLEALSLVAPQPGTAAAPAAAPAPALAAQRALDGSSLPRLDRAQLYTYLTAQGKPRLGLIKGFRFALDVERCQELGELQSLALQFVDMVREAQGEGAADEVKRELGMTI